MDSKKTEIKAESLLNREDDSLPYAYFNPQTNGKLTWVCGNDAENRITSVFSFDHGTFKDKQCQYLENIDKAKYIRQELVSVGWQKLKPPEITFTFPGEKEDRKLNRKERRYLQHKLKRMNKNNPFNGSDETKDNSEEKSSNSN